MFQLESVFVPLWFNFFTEKKKEKKMPTTGQLSNHFVEGMRKIYELEPFIKLESLLTEEGKKELKIYKRAV